jgi:hypothetical protein
LTVGWRRSARPCWYAGASWWKPGAGAAYSEPDVLIAASALVEQPVVVTRDVREFVEAGVPVLDPWTRSLSLPGRRDRKLESLDRTDLLDVIGHS